MYRFSIWKIVLIIGVLIFSALYLIPTPDRFYNPLYGNLPLWMQEKLPPFEISEDNAFKVNLAEVEYPEGINFQDVTFELQDVFRVHLRKLGFEETLDYQFDTTEAREFYVRLARRKHFKTHAQRLTIYTYTEAFLESFGDSYLIVG